MVEFEKRIKIYASDCKNKFNLKGIRKDWDSSQEMKLLNCFTDKTSSEDIKFLLNDYKKYMEKKSK